MSPCACWSVFVCRQDQLAGFRGFRGSQCEIDCGCGHHGQCNSKNVPWSMVIFRQPEKWKWNQWNLLVPEVRLFQIFNLVKVASKNP